MTLTTIPFRAAASLTALALFSSLAGCGQSPERDQASEASLKLVQASAERQTGDPAAIDTVVDGMDRLAGALYAGLADDDGNLALSPYSAAAALAMTSNGARHTTQKEMLAVLGVDDLDALNGGLNALTQRLESLAGGVDEDGDGKPDREVELAAANALFGQDDVTWAEPFLETLARDFGAGMRVVDFKHDARAARRAINGWTAEQTRDRIPELLGEGTLSELTRLVLVNALYFKAPWASEFTPSGDREFDLDGDNTVSAPMMSTSLTNASYRADDTWQAVTVPYLGGELAMTIVLPQAGQQGAVEQQVIDGGLGAMLADDATTAPTVDLTMPKWEFRTKANLVPPLQQAGMARAFTSDAEFEPMAAPGTASADRDLQIDTVLQESFIAVDEQGTEAAAATAVEMGVRSAPMPDQPITMLCDRPFLFVIHDVEHRTPLFLGRVSDPTA
ncbi:serpin family protein [Nocardioides sp. Bht2]|uniref:serpin family protein n=1 Tax=Nocardioides sp. Bht2 TaxID=3392297 RepID=UPI0039B43992